MLLDSNQAKPKDDAMRQRAGGHQRRFAREIALAAAVTCAAACGASPIGGPDPARSTFFQSTMVDGGSLPYRFRMTGDLTDTYLLSARLVPLDLGRTTDTRIFDDRGGTGSGSGNGRDTTVSTGRMADIRVFAGSPAGAGKITDSIVVDVVRVGDIMYITRPHPDPTRNVTDTAEFGNGVLVRPLSYWRNFNEAKTGRQLVYTTVR